MNADTLADLPRPSPLAVFLGVVRVLGVFVLLVVGTAVLLPAALLPGQPGGATPAMWVAVGIARVFLGITGTALVADAPEELRAHRGFVFFNHLSHLDPVVLLAVAPVRFLATAGVRGIPFVGWIAAAVGTLFVNRGDEESRERARGELRTAVAAGSTPVALAPEGGITDGPGVGPLRHGAFEVAVDADADVLLVALRFEPPGYAAWLPDEWLVFPLWRLCARTGPFSVRLIPLAPVFETRPVASEATDPADLAAEASRRLDAVLLADA